MDRGKITRELDWFCHHVVAEHVMSLQDCVAAVEALEAAGAEVSLESFIGKAVELGALSSPEAVGRQRQMAMNEARVFGSPSRSVFSAIKEPPRKVQPEKGGAGAMAVEAAGGRTTAPPPLQSPPPLKPIVSGVQTAKPLQAQDGAWLRGWPVLSGAAAKGGKGAREILDSFLQKARSLGCSDIHLSAGAFPFVRRFKQMHLLEDQGVLSPEDAEALNLVAMDEEQARSFEESLDIDYGYALGPDDRYRVNVMRQRIGVSGSYRVIDTKARSIRELGFPQPEVIEKLTTYGQGLILVTGPAGSGKSTTLSALVDYINRTRHDHIITVEDPIEVVHMPVNCNVTQRELNRHTRSFGNALRAALREDPDVIVVGELRDLETMEMAIHASETGHLVIGTLHTSSASETMNRVLDVFPHGQQAQIRAMVAESLKGVICQQLLPNADGSGVVLAAEILLGTLAVSNLIREGKTYQIDSTIQTSRNVGMVTMEQSHYGLYCAGLRTYEQTLPFVRSRELVRSMQQHEAARLSPGRG